VEARVCNVEELSPGTVRTAMLGSDAQGLPILAILLRDQDGVIRAYRNLCRHLPVPLDAGTGDLLSKSGRHLLCATHGATYRLSDGTCIKGPCEGLSLHPLSWVEREGELFVSYGSRQGVSSGSR
jgi:nitrite reductase/ring-hydroxylating ferredoxin subunit